MLLLLIFFSTYFCINVSKIDCIFLSYGSSYILLQSIYLGNFRFFLTVLAVTKTASIFFFHVIVNLFHYHLFICLLFQVYLMLVQLLAFANKGQVT